MNGDKNVAVFMCASCDEYRNAANRPNYNAAGERICHPCELLAADDVEESIKEGLRAIRRQSREYRTDPVYHFDLPLDSDAWPCPQGCGGLTEDAAGGPCKACWAKVPGPWDQDDEEDYR